MVENGIDWLMMGKRIAEMRMARGLTQMDLAEKLGLSPNYIGYIEQGKRHAKFETYVQIVTAMGYSLNDLFLPEFRNSLSNCLAWEISIALSDCREDKQESVVRIVQDMVQMIRLFRS